MKLLLDENLSRKLVDRLSDLFSGSTHVSLVGFERATDVEIWDFARENGFVIVTADGDFYGLALTLGPPPKVIWLRGCDYPTAAAERLIRGQAVRIAEFLRDESQAILILTPRHSPPGNVPEP